jgi:hypothetical protein
MYMKCGDGVLKKRSFIVFTNYGKNYEIFFHYWGSVASPYYGKVNTTATISMS